MIQFGALRVKAASVTTSAIRCRSDIRGLLFAVDFLCIYGIVGYTRKGAVLLTATVKRWGNSAAVRIPRSVLSQANIEEGTDVEIVVTREGEIKLTAVRKRKSIQELFAGYDEGFFQTEEADWGEPQGNEVW